VRKCGVSQFLSKQQICQCTLPWEVSSWRGINIKLYWLTGCLCWVFREVAQYQKANKPCCLHTQQASVGCSERSSGRLPFQTSNFRNYFITFLKQWFKDFSNNCHRCVRVGRTHSSESLLIAQIRRWKPYYSKICLKRGLFFFNEVHTTWTNSWVLSKFNIQIDYTKSVTLIIF
jgi:hypothetical protein